MRATATQAPNMNAFQLKGSMITFTVLQLLSANNEAFTAQLELLAHQTPNFFKYAPIIIDLERLLESDQVIDFAHIKSELQRHSLVPVGIRHANDLHTQAAIQAGLALLSSSKPETHKSSISANNASKNNTSKIITQPVRSGQQIYAQNTDLIVLAPVSAGSELLADGNIHVYGPLRGRAIAGVSGDRSARIFCLKLEAELIAIAGYYRLNEDMKIPKGTNGIQVFLEDEKLLLQAI